METVGGSLVEWFEGSLWSKLKKIFGDIDKFDVKVLSFFDVACCKYPFGEALLIFKEGILELPRRMIFICINPVGNKLEIILRDFYVKNESIYKFQ